MKTTNPTGKSAGKIFADRLREARTSAGYYSQGEFAIRLAVDEKTYRRWESGECRPRVSSFLQICRVTNKDPFWFQP